MQYQINLSDITYGIGAKEIHFKLEQVKGIDRVEICEISQCLRVEYDNASAEEISEVLKKMGVANKNLPRRFGWKDITTWSRSAKNTGWCLLGCSIGEFGTLIYYSYSGITSGLLLYSPIWYFYAILPLVNGLLTSIILETFILMRSHMLFSNALSTALGMSFISMLVMEITMEVTDLVFTKGSLILDFRAVPLMLLFGFLAAWPYNYWRLKKYGISCH